MTSKNDELIKTEFNFGWKKWDLLPHYAEPTLKNQKGDILDIGCATCELYKFLKSRGWEGNYYGIDIKKFEDYEYPEGVNLIIGDPLEIDLPEVDTIILYNILEHVDYPLELLKKSVETSKENVLVNVPKRNEELWGYNIVEFHQLDKTHKHCGFSKEELFKLSELAGGKVVNYLEFGEFSVVSGVNLWKNILPKLSIYLLNKIFSSKKYYQEIWFELVKK